MIEVHDYEPTMADVAGRAEDQVYIAGNTEQSQNGM
jgi:hypothetical protein